MKFNRFYSFSITVLSLITLCVANANIQSSYTKIQDGFQKSNIQYLLKNGLTTYAVVNPFSLQDDKNLYEKTDGTDSWKKTKTTGIEDVNWPLKKLYKINGTFFASGGYTYKDNYQHSLYRSVDIKNWSPSDSGLPMKGSLISMTYNKKSGSLFALVSARYRQGGIFRSVDSGKTWKKLTNGLPVFTGVYLTISNNTLYYLIATVGLYKSNSNGDTWTMASNDPMFKKNWYPKIYGFGDSTNGVIFTATQDDGLFRSIDDGHTWVKSAQGFKGTKRYINNMIKHNGVLYASVSKRADVKNPILYSSTDDGITWSPLKISGVPTEYPGDIDSIMIDNNNIVLSYSLGSHSIYTGKDYSYKFVPHDNGIPTLNNLRALYSNSGYLYASTTNYGGKSIAVYRSHDGVKWTPMSPYLANNISLIKSFTSLNNILYISTVGGEGVYKSSDNGLSWTPVANGLPGGNDKWVNTISNVNNVLYASVYGSTPNGKIYKSNDGGTSWNIFSQGLPNNRYSYYGDIVDNLGELYTTDDDSIGLYEFSNKQSKWINILPDGNLPASSIDYLTSVKNTLYAYIDSKGLYKSTNEKKWTLVTGIPDDMDIHAIKYFNNYFYAAGHSNSDEIDNLYVSTDGLHWARANVGNMPHANVLSIAEFKNKLYLATEDIGLWQGTLKQA